jgi:hypothetical protein
MQVNFVPPAAPVKKPSAIPTDFFGRTPNAYEALAPVSLPRIPGLDPSIQGQAKQAQQTYQSGKADVDRYRALLGDIKPPAQETDFLSGLFSPGGVEASLGGIRSRKNAALSGLHSQLLGDLQRAMGLGQVGRGAQGLGSYLTRLAGTEAGRLRTQEATAAADQERSDLAALLNLRMAGLGRADALQQNRLAQTLLPMQAEQSLQSNYASMLSAALQNALANSIFAYSLPEMA